MTISPSVDMGLLFDTLLESGEYELACATAMRVADQLLAESPEHSRRFLFDRYFRKLDKRYRAQYQSYDFEICDYRMYTFSRSSMLFRGPRPDIAELGCGRYVTIFGAAQLFGRFQPYPFHIRVQDQLKLPVLNLASGGAGPDFYLSSDFIEVANRGRAVVLQILSGRSVGCEEYPGERLTARAGSGEPRRDRIELLQGIWEGDRAEAIRLVSKWRENYFFKMTEIIRAMHVPVYLVWMSSRKPGDWGVDRLEHAADFGDFPHLVDESTVQRLAELATEYVEVGPDPQPIFRLTSRLTGQPCPFFWNDGRADPEDWTNYYYPSEAPHAELFDRMAEPLMRTVGGEG